MFHVPSILHVFSWFLDSLIILLTYLKENIPRIIYNNTLFIRKYLEILMFICIPPPPG